MTSSFHIAGQQLNSDLSDLDEFKIAMGEQLVNSKKMAVGIKFTKCSSDQLWASAIKNLTQGMRHLQEFEDAKAKKCFADAGNYCMMLYTQADNNGLVEGEVFK